MNGLEVRRLTPRAILWILLLVVIVLYGFPFLYLVLTSFKTPSDAIAVPPAVLPRTWTLENYVTALAKEGVVPALLNSVVTAVLSTAMSLVLAVPAAYAITRYRTPSGRVFVIASLVTRMVPTIAIGAPLVETMRTLGINDTSVGLAIAHTTISLPLSIWLMASFFEAVPDELEEAARVDGAGRAQAFRRVILPLAVPGLIAAGVLAFVFSWNEFTVALNLTSRATATVPVGIANFAEQYEVQNGNMAAASVLSTIPALILMLFGQRFVVQGLTMGAVK